MSPAMILMLSLAPLTIPTTPSPVTLAILPLILRPRDPQEEFASPVQTTAESVTGEDQDNAMKECVTLALFNF